MVTPIAGVNNNIKTGTRPIATKAKHYVKIKIIIHYPRHSGIYLQYLQLRRQYGTWTYAWRC